MPLTLKFKVPLQTPGPEGKRRAWSGLSAARSGLCCGREHGFPERFAANAKNPLRYDPTRTLSLRRSFMQAMNGCFLRLNAALKDFLVTKDALGLEDKPTSLVLHIAKREYEFKTDPQKLTAFNDWFKEQVDALVLSPDPGTPPGQPWTTQYVESAYRRGQLNAFIAGRDFAKTDQTPESFLRSSFGQPETMSKVSLLGTRTYEHLKGITATMSSDMSRILAQGLADGKGPEAIAKEMTGRIDSLSNTRAMTIARTEIINAHSEGQLDAFERLGVKELGVKAEWSTAGDERVCDLCAPLEGQVFSMEEARGMIPLHPNCRCAWIPFLGEVTLPKSKPITPPQPARVGPAKPTTRYATPPDVPEEQEGVVF